jgi:Transglycosylase SLT domain
VVAARVRRPGDARAGFLALASDARGREDEVAAGDGRACRIELGEHGRDVDAAVRRCVPCEPARPLGELPLAAWTVAPARLVPGDGEVNEALEEVALVVRGRAPRELQLLVRLEVRACANAGEARLQSVLDRAVGEDPVMFALVAAAVLAVAPPPTAPLPSGAAETARQLAATTRSLTASIEDWRDTATPRQPRALRLWALHQQRLYLALGLASRQTGDTVLARLPAALRADARDVITARRALVRLTQPTTLPLAAFRTGPAEPADRLLGHYREAQRRFGIPWSVLAAVNFVETAFGKVRSASIAGAQGPMQFLPGTWRRYGLGGDVHDPRDAILGAANLLRASGAPRDLRRALYAYNPSSLYVDAVVAYARVMRRDVRAFYGFHAWQVFVRTRRGYRRITSP